MKQIPLSQGKIALVDDQDFEWLNQWKWTHSKGYAIRSIWKGKRVYMHRLIVNTPEGMETDHINRNKLDNTRANLRIASHAENNRNTPPEKTNKSGYKGVIWNKHARKWRAYIVSGKQIHLGYFNDILQAAKAYNDKAREIFGDFAFLNRIGGEIL